MPCALRRGVCCSPVMFRRRGTRTGPLPGGKVEQAEDPFDAVVREVAEETGCVSVVERLLGVDSRVIPAAEARLGIEHCRSSLVDVGLALARTLPATGHVSPVAVGGLIRH
ncbi:NUDIX hydrolase [Micromonospora arida]